MNVINPFASDQGSLLAAQLERARNQQLSLGELFQMAESLRAPDNRRQAAELYKAWIAFNDANPLLHLAYFNYSVALQRDG